MALGRAKYPFLTFQANHFRVGRERKRREEEQKEDQLLEGL